MLGETGETGAAAILGLSTASGPEKFRCDVQDMDAMRCVSSECPVVPFMSRLYFATMRKLSSGSCGADGRLQMSASKLFRQILQKNESAEIGKSSEYKSCLCRAKVTGDACAVCLGRKAAYLPIRLSAGVEPGIRPCLLTAGKENGSRLA